MATVVLTGWMAVCSDRDTYRWDTTIPALEQIERHGIPLVPLLSGTLFLQNP
jgi:hypothetical protein